MDVEKTPQEPLQNQLTLGNIALRQLATVLPAGRNFPA